MSEGDFDQSDAGVLAEFAGLKYEEDGSGNILIVKSANYSVHWCPWSLEAPMWQIQSLLDAVREKGLEDKFCWEILDVLKINEEKRFLYDDIVDCVSAPPEAICAAILKLEGE